MSSLIAVTSIPTESDLSQCGQSYESAFHIFVAWAALITRRLTCLNSALQCGHKLMESPSLVGCGVEIASYREGDSPFSGRHASPTPGREGHHSPGSVDRSGPVRGQHAIHPYPVADMAQHEAAPRDSHDLYDVSTY